MITRRGFFKRFAAVVATLVLAGKSKSKPDTSTTCASISDYSTTSQATVDCYAAPCEGIIVYYVYEADDWREVHMENTDTTILSILNGEQTC